MLGRFNRLTTVQNVEQAIDEISDCNSERQDCKPVLFDEGPPLVAVRESLVFDKFAKEDIAPDRAQSECDWVKNQPEDDVFCRYFRPVFLVGIVDMITIS